MRNKRDATLAAPVLLLPSIQANIRAGKLPRAESNGVRCLKIPMTLDIALTDSTWRIRPDGFGLSMRRMRRTPNASRHRGCLLTGSV